MSRAPLLRALAVRALLVVCVTTSGCSSGGGDGDGGRDAGPGDGGTDAAGDGSAPDDAGADGDPGSDAAAEDGGPPASDAILLHPEPFAEGEDVEFDVTADSREVVFSIESTSRAELFAVGVDGADHRALGEPSDGDIAGFAVSPYGPNVVYASDRGGVHVDLASGDHSVLDFDLSPGFGGGLPCAFVPDGSHLLCNDGGDRYLVPLDGAAATRLAHVPTIQIEPSPDGRFIAWVASGELVIHEIDGGAETRLGDGANQLAWMSDSSGLVFTQSTAGSDPGMFTVASDGAGVTKLTADVPTDMLVSPDGNWVAYRTSTDISLEYHLYALATSGDGSPVPFDVTGYERGHDTSGLRLDAITPDSGYLLYAVGATTEHYHMPLIAGALDGSGDRRGVSSISGFPTLRTGHAAGVTEDSSWVVYGVTTSGGSLSSVAAASLEGEPDRQLLPGLPDDWWLRGSLEEALAIGPRSVVVRAGDPPGLVRTDLTTDDPPQELVGPTRVQAFRLSPSADHVVYLQQSADGTTHELYALGLR